MSTKVQIIKRLEMIKNAVELEDYEIVHLQLTKLKEENDQNLNTILELIEQNDYSKISKAIDDYVYGFKNSNLTPHQQEIFDQLVQDINKHLETHHDQEISKENCFFSLTGSAGVGKTFVSSKLIEYFVAQKYKILLTTPTHKSLGVAKYILNANNVHVPSRTLQSYLDLKLDKDLIKGTKVFKRNKTDHELDYEKDLDILIVDESSMVSNELLKFIEENLLQSKLKIVLFIGDPYQLPPVDSGTNGVETLPKQFILTQIVRQAQDSYIKVIANELKECIKNKTYTPVDRIFDQTIYPTLEKYYEEREFLKDFTKKDKWYECNNVIISYTNDIVDEFNRIIRYTYWKNKGIEATEAILPGEILIFNEGYGNKFQNSEIITVTKAEKSYNEFIKLHQWICIESLGRSFKVIDPDDVQKFNEYVTKVSKEAANLSKTDPERKKKWRHYFAIKEEYADMKYIYASTIHKVQGSTYNTAYIDLSSIFSLIQRKELDLAYRLMYVAVTRASKDIKILR